MAQSKYEYVKKYEQDDTLLLGCYIVIRLDGKGFTKWVNLGPHTCGALVPNCSLGAPPQVQ